jgi:putative two-component system hydrogenase maturation factor HypX/HoxX
MRILLIANAFNSLTQRVFAELGERGHRLAVHLMTGDDALLREAVRQHIPDLIVAPALTAAVPEDVRSAHTCLVVHPGPPGDRGPSSLDRALHEGEETWGVTVLQADAVPDAGDIWASVPCPLPPRGKGDLYRNEISDAAVEAVLLAVDRFASGGYLPRPQHGPEGDVPVRTRPYLCQDERRIDWTAEPTEVVLRKLRAADSRPGVRDELLGGQFFLHGGCAEDELRGRPGELLATRSGAVCRATADGAVWLPELRPCRTPGGPATFRLPAVLALGDRLPGLPEIPAPLWPARGGRTWADLTYREEGPVGFLRFSFPGGAMSTDHCRRLLHAYRHACSRPTSVLVLGGGRDFFSNGMHLNVIEAAADPAQESWENALALNDLVEAVLTTTDRLVVAALGGNAAAGGVMLALAADEVWCRDGAVLNPHFRLMGLHGSAYWTYSLPRRVGSVASAHLVQKALPVTAARARRLGLVQRVVEAGPEEFGQQVARMAGALARTHRLPERVGEKKAARERHEAAKPLAAYRAEELAAMHHTFFDPEAPYHRLRSAFVRKERVGGTPPHLATADRASLPGMREEWVSRGPRGR